MAQASNPTTQGLYWVKQELASSLQRVRDFVEAYLETPANSLPLQRALVELHQIRGTLRMVQCEGAALLAEEMKAAVQDLLKELDDAPEKAFEALLGSTLQLTDYLDLVVAGESDNALIFLPIINELRVSRGAGVASESALFVTYASMHGRAPQEPDLEGRPTNGAQAVAKQRLPGFQMALLRVLKDQDTPTSLKRLAEIAEAMAATATNSRGQRLFTAMDALVSALLDGSVDIELEIKRLLGRVGQHIKNAAESGDAILQDVPDSLIYGLVYFAGRARNDNPKILVLREAYGLDLLLPGRDKLNALRARLRGPNTGLVNKLSAEIRDDIGKVKDSIDLVIRAGDKAAVNLEDTAKTTDGIADTLGMLGLDMLKRVVANQAQAILNLAQSGERDQDAWMDVALALLRVEQGLDSALFRHLHSGSAAEEDEAAGTEVVPRQDIDAGTAAIYREALVNLSRVKTLIPDYLAQGEAALQREAAHLLHEVEAGLQIVNQTDGAAVLSRLRQFINSSAMTRARRSDGTVLVLADAVASVEYYLEGLATSQVGSDAGFERAKACVDQLVVPHEEAQVPLGQEPEAVVSRETAPKSTDQPIPTEPEQTEPEQIGHPEAPVDAVEDAPPESTPKSGLESEPKSELEPESESESEQILELGAESAPEPAPEAGLKAEPESEPESEPQPKFAAAAEPQAEVTSTQQLDADVQPAEAIDPEIREIFVEEAQEVLEGLQRDVPAWANNLDDAAGRLGDIRRAFHTLKGSGRMVGAIDLGEFGWAMECLLNQCLEQAIATTSQVVAVVQKSVVTLPGLIDDFQNNRESEAGDEVIAQADALSGRVSEAAKSAQAQRQDDSQEDSQGDSELYRIFRDDAHAHIRTIREFSEQFAPCGVTADLVRALHTLKGSAQAVHAPDISHLASALEQFTDTSRAAQQPIQSDAMIVLGEAANVFEARVDELQTAPDDAHTDTEALLARVMQLGADLPQEAVEASSDRKLVVIFTDEACDVLDEMDHGITDWRATPADAHHPQQVKALCHKLKGSAHTSDATNIARVIEALEAKIEAHLRNAQVPNDDEFEALHEVVDGLYDLLDRFRNGERRADVQVLLAMLGSADTGPEPKPEPELDIEPEIEPEIEQEPATEPKPLEPSAPEAVAPAPPEEIVEQAPESPEAPESSPESSIAPPESPESPFERDADPELIAIFIEEADELLEGIHTEVDAWTESPTLEEPRLALMRYLHTLKGSARMAGINVVGDLSHDLETLVAGAHSPQKRRDVLLLESLRKQADQLHSELDSARSATTASDNATAETVAEPPAAVQSDAIVSSDESPIHSSTQSSSQSSETSPIEPAAEEALVGAAESTEPAVSAGSAESAESAQSATAVVAPREFDSRLYWTVQDQEPETKTQEDTARVAVNRLEDMLNEAGEMSIYRARLEQQTTGLQFQLRELAQTTGRLREQLRTLDAETEAQIMARHESSADRYDEEFDPLEMDRYSTLHELSRGLAESVTDLGSLHGFISDLVEQGEALLTQQGRVNTSLQQGLMRTLMVPFSLQVQRLQRILRQVSEEHGRRARITFGGVEAELDRNVLERMAAPLEHLLRNAIIHGLETPQERSAAAKDEVGLISVKLHREGTQLVIAVRDDGRGLNLQAIRETAVSKKLLRDDARIDDADLAAFIFEPGFSTAAELTQDAGRGVGLDVVNAQIKQLGGSMAVDSQAGQGVCFTVRLPLTLAITQALMVRVGDETYAVPIGSVEGVTRVAGDALPAYMDSDTPSFAYGGLSYRMLGLAEMLGGAPAAIDEDNKPRSFPVLLARAGERRSAFVVDGMLGSREIVVKSVGPQVSTVPGISGATVRADGEVVLILDIAALMQLQVRQALGTEMKVQVAEVTDDRPLVMVVDDSITIRRVSERFLTRSGMRVVTAKDGMDALAKLQSNTPDAVLLDIEMPRIDGFELATYMRNSESLKNTPIIMITSRSGDKHRRRAEQIGVDKFMTKPYQDQDLLQQLYAVMRKKPNTAH